MISAAKYGRLVAFHFREVVTQLPEVHFWALPPTSITSRTLEVIEMFPDATWSLFAVSTVPISLRRESTYLHDGGMKGRGTCREGT